MTEKEADEALGRAIKVLRTARGLGRRELAERAGVSYPYLSEIENGSKPGSPRVLRAIAEALDAPLHELMAAADELQPPPARAAFLKMPMEAGAIPAPRAPQRASWFRTRSEPSPPPEQASSARDALVQEVQNALPSLADEDLERVRDLVRRLVR